MAEADTTILAEYKADSKMTVNEPDRAAFRAATAAVIDKWKAKPFGEFVSKVAAAATA
jgi:TRAP-type C4-dicarboxylate transport system substrate-binding protein